MKKRITHPLTLLHPISGIGDFTEVHVVMLDTVNKQAYATATVGLYPTGEYEGWEEYLKVHDGRDIAKEK